MDDRVKPNLGTAETAPVCYCFEVSEREVEQAIRVLKLTTLAEITRYTRAGGGCQTCWIELDEILVRCARGEFKYPLTEQDAQRVRDAAARVRASAAK